MLFIIFFWTDTQPSINK